MMWFKRISLFLLTNLLVMATLSIAWALISSFLGINYSQMGGLFGFALVWGMGGAFISLLLSKQMAKWMMGVQIINPATAIGENAKIYETVRALAGRAGLSKCPEVGIYESPDINAFATGPSRSNALVAVSSGLLSRMSDSEIEGVLGHEIAHITNGDMVTMTLIQGVVNAFVIFFSRIVSRIVASQVDEKWERAVYFLSTILFDIAFTILGSIVVNYFSRQREFRADAGGAQYAGREKMVAGLRRLQSQMEMMTRSGVEPEQSKDAMACLKISGRPSGLLGLFSTHPPLEERIRRLQEGGPIVRS